MRSLNMKSVGKRVFVGHGNVDFECKRHRGKWTLKVKILRKIGFLVGTVVKHHVHVCHHFFSFQWENKTKVERL